MEDWKVLPQGLLPKSGIISVIECGLDSHSLWHTLISRIVEERLQSSSSQERLLVYTLSAPSLMTDYVSISRRIGRDLNMLRATGKISFFDDFNLMDDSNLEKIESSFQSISSNSLVVLEGLDAVLSVCEEVVVKRLMQLIELIESKSELLLIKTSSCVSGGSLLSRWIAHRASMAIIVRPLPSLLLPSRGVYGEFFILYPLQLSEAKSPSNYPFAPSGRERHFLFKATDSTVSVLERKFQLGIIDWASLI